MHTETDTPTTQPPQPAHAGWRSRNVARTALIALAIWFGLQLFWTVNALIFLVFLATLFGLAVARGVDFLERWKIRRGVGSALIVFGTIGVIGGGLAWTAPTLITQGQELQKEFPAAIQQVQHWLDSSRGGMWGSLLGGSSASAEGAVQQVPLQQRLTAGVSGASKYLFSFVSNTIEMVGAFILIVFLAIYIGAEPDIYRGWLLSAVPAASRAHARIVLREVSKVLRKWLVTQLIAMLAIGITSGLVMMLLGVKAPFALGFIAGLLEFIPTVGPILSAVPAALMGFVDSPEKALTVIIAYWGIQFVEGNLLIPYLMRGEMDLPPAITLIAQALMTLVFGFIGLMVAVPVTAAILVPLRMIAERENERERDLHRQRNADRDLLTDAVDSEKVMEDADQGPPPYAKLPSTTRTLRTLT